MLLIVAMEEAVFLRSEAVFGEVNGGDATASFGCEVFLDSQENGLVNFLVGGGAGAGRLEP